MRLRNAASLFAVLLSSCQVIGGFTERTNAGAQTCLHNSDCEPSDRCIFQTCSVECEADRDCAPGARCLRTKSDAACVSVALAACSQNGDCPNGTVCASGACRTSCTGSDACLDTQQCSSDGVCVGTDAEHDSGLASGGSAGVGGANTSSGGVATSGTAGDTVGGAAQMAGSGGAPAGGKGGAGPGGGAGGFPGGGMSGSSGGGAGGAGGGGVCPPKAVFCDDFEAQTSGVAPQGQFSVKGLIGDVIVDSTKPFGGTQSVHIKAAKPGSTSQLVFTKQFPLTGLYGRAMIYLARLPAPNVHYDLVYAQGAGGKTWAVGGMNGKYIFVDASDNGLASQSIPAIGKWLCLEWQFNSDKNDSAFAARVDGQALDNGVFVGTDPTNHPWSAPTWIGMSIGFINYQPISVDIDEWLDDLDFGTARMGCPTPP